MQIRSRIKKTASPVIESVSDDDGLLASPADSNTAGGIVNTTDFQMMSDEDLVIHGDSDHDKDAKPINVGVGYYKGTLSCSYL